MFSKHRPYYAEININNFRHNFKEVKRVANGKKTFGIIKADAYGHGAVELARILVEEGVDYLGVAVITEAIELRRNNINKPILVLGFTPPTLARAIVENDITQAVFNYDLAKAISEEAVSLGKIAKIHIKIDTGMGRVGYLQEENAINEILKISRLDNIMVEGIFTHFSSSDELDKEFTKLQIQKFKDVVNKLNENGLDVEIKHVANSGAIIDMNDAYFDGIRPGIILYGYYPSNEVNKEIIKLKPVMTIKADIVNIKDVPENTPISYGRRFYTQKPSKIATLPFGYADGFTRLLFGKATVIVNGKEAPVVGRICMDQCMIDVTECGDVKVGDEVIVMGEENGIKNNADTFAEKLGTINYEILCMVSKRVPRIYVENNKIVKEINYV